jgi:hypothetical protein
MATYRRTHTPGSKKTSTANQVIDFYNYEMSPPANCKVQFLHFQTFAQEVSIKINDETTVHWIAADSEQIFQDIDIDKITIVNAGAEYYYTAMSVE